MTRVMLSDDEGVAIYSPSVHITTYELSEIVQLFGVHCAPNNCKRDWRKFIEEKEIGRNFIFRSHDEQKRAK